MSKLAHHVYNKLSELNVNMRKLNEDYMEIWKDDIFLTWRWWLNIAILVLPWLIWFLLRKKDSTYRLLLAGFFVYLVTSILDSIGITFGLWFYMYTPLPDLHTYYFPWDFGAFPIMVMTLIQFKPHINPYLKALFFSLISAVVFEPVFAKLGLYVAVRWEYYYGIPIYFVIFLLAHSLACKKDFKGITE
ncbi:CBO0543 family protein [Mesobacillus zeae]|uniref:CBO0543 family protein n=1 Tax=Mesobacillus zeae TaxID=1917180 RepID=UPI00115D331B|nr:CBO0543 family protein [Mesobacillus zeae]